MTTLAVTVDVTTDTTQDTSTVPTYTLENIEIRDGTLTTGLWPYVRNAIDDLLTIPSSGLTFSDGSWEIVITMKPKDSHGFLGSIQEPKEMTFDSITRVSMSGLDYCERLGLRDI